MKCGSKYSYSMKLGLEKSLEYRIDFILSIFGSAFPIIVQYFIWLSVYNNSSLSYIYGYTFEGMVSYIIFASIVSKFIAAGFEYEIGRDIKDGGLNKYIIKPISYFKYRISCFIGNKTVQFLLDGIILFISYIVLNRTMNVAIELTNVITFIIVIPICIVLNFLIFYAVSSMSFWTGEIWGIVIAIRMLVNILSGGVLPLDVFGDKINEIFKYMPFRYIIYFPINVLMGRVDAGEVRMGIIIQIVWIIIVYIIGKILWKIGIKKYVSTGG